MKKRQSKKGISGKKLQNRRFYTFIFSFCQCKTLEFFTQLFYLCLLFKRWRCSSSEKTESSVCSATFKIYLSVKRIPISAVFTTLGAFASMHNVPLLDRRTYHITHVVTTVKREGGCMGFAGQQFWRV